MTHFGNLPIWSWTDGAVVGTRTGDHRGPGGHLRAMLPGRYRVVVRSSDGSACPAFRLAVARSDFAGPTMPEW
jgi:hypothetical protein